MSADIAARDGVSEQLETVELETSLIVFGYFAAWYASSGITPKPAMPGWGADLKHKSIVVGNSSWTAAVMTREWNGALTLGLAITEHTGHNAGGGPKHSYWVPMSALASVSMKLPGVRL